MRLPFNNTKELHAIINKHFQDETIISIIRNPYGQFFVMRADRGNNYDIIEKHYDGTSNMITWEGIVMSWEDLWDELYISDIINREKEWVSELEEFQSLNTVDTETKVPISYNANGFSIFYPVHPSEIQGEEYILVPQYATFDEVVRAIENGVFERIQVEDETYNGDRFIELCETSDDAIHEAKHQWDRLPRRNRTNRVIQASIENIDGEVIEILWSSDNLKDKYGCAFDKDNQC